MKTAIDETTLRDSTAVIQTVALCKRYGAVEALVGLDLQVAAGEVFCLLGANGAGKSTTLNLLLGFLEPTSGAARIAGIDVSADPARARRQVAYVPEQVTLYERLTGLENLGYFLALAEQRSSVEQLRNNLSAVGLAVEAHERPVSTYSKGMRQKVALALAAARRAQALLLDEPTSGLDPKASSELTRLLRRHSDAGTAVLMATHDLFHAKEVGHRVGIMKAGRLVATLRTADVGHADLERIYLEHMHD